MVFGWNSAKTPLLALLFSTTFWGAAWVPLRGLEQYGLPGLWVSLTGYLVSAPLLWWFHRPSRQLLQAHGRWLLALALTAGWANLAFILAMLDGVVMRVLLLFYLSPLWSVLLAALLLGERITRRTALVMMMALLGMVIMLWQPGASAWSPNLSWVDWLSLSAGLAFAFSNVVVRKLVEVSVDEKLMATWLGVVAFAVLGLLWRGEGFPSAGAGAFALAGVLGVAGFYLAAVCLYYGLARMTVQRSAVILLFELVAGGVSSALLANEFLSLHEWLGGFLIVWAGVLVIRQGETG